MTRDRLVTVFVALVAATVVTVVVWLMFFRPLREHTTRVVTTPIVGSPFTPLRDSGPRNNARASHLPASRQSPRSPTASRLPPTTAGSHRRPLPPRKRKAPKAPRKRHPAPPRPAQPPPPSGPPPPPQKQCPPVTITAPAPVTVTTPVLGVNCG